MKISLSSLVLTALIALSSASVASAQQEQTVSIMSGGLTRTFLLHLPSPEPVATNLPVLLCYHGSGGTSASMESTSGFNAFADQDNFIAVYPQSATIGGDLQWNVYVDDQPGHAGVGDPNAPDDAVFTHDIITYLSDHYQINRNRVFASGLSNGGYMCYALAVFLSKEIAAIAPVAGNLWGDATYLQQAYSSQSIRPIPVMHVHGTADKTVDYPDPNNQPDPDGEWPLWFVARACGSQTYSQVVPIMQNVDKLVFCPPPTEVSLIRITGMDHAWSNGVYPTASEIVKFFGLAGNASVADGAGPPAESRIMSNVAASSVRVDLASSARIMIANVSGAVVLSERLPAGAQEIPTSGLSTGLYFVRVVPDDGSAGIQQKVMLLR